MLRISARVRPSRSADDAEYQPAGQTRRASATPAGRPLHGSAQDPAMSAAQDEGVEHHVEGVQHPSEGGGDKCPLRLRRRLVPKHLNKLDNILFKWPQTEQSTKLMSHYWIFFRTTRE